MQARTVLGDDLNNGPPAVEGIGPIPPAGRALISIAQCAVSASAEIISRILCTETTCQRTARNSGPYPLRGSPHPSTGVPGGSQSPLRYANGGTRGGPAGGR